MCNRFAVLFKTFQSFKPFKTFIRTSSVLASIIPVRIGIQSFILT